MTASVPRFSNQGVEYDVDRHRKFDAVYTVTVDGVLIGTARRFTAGKRTRWEGRTPEGERLATSLLSRTEVADHLMGIARKVGLLPSATPSGAAGGTST